MTGLGVCLLLSSDKVREKERASLQVRHYNTGTTPCISVSLQEMFGFHLPWVGTAVIGIWERREREREGE